MISRAGSRSFPRVDHGDERHADEALHVTPNDHCIGATVARDTYPDHIVIYEDTLTRDFGHNPDLLRAQVERTVRHELAHHLGWDERGVRGLGL